MSGTLVPVKPTSPTGATAPGSQTGTVNPAGSINEKSIAAATPVPPKTPTVAPMAGATKPVKSDKPSNGLAKAPAGPMLVKPPTPGGVGKALLPWDHRAEQARANQRHDTATAAVGLGGVGGGAALREHGISLAHTAQKRPKRAWPPSRSIVTRGAGAKGRVFYAGGSLIGLAATPAAAVGAYNLTHPKGRVTKADNKIPPPPPRTFINEGVVGATDALNNKIGSLKQRNVSNRARVGAAAGSIGGGSLASLAMHRVLDHAPHAVSGRVRAVGTASAGVLGAVAALPLSTKLAGRHYTVTPAGVRRAKTAPRRATRHRDVNTTPQRREFGKAEVPAYPGGGLSHKQKRAAVYAAGAAGPVVGDIAAAGMAARLAPPGHRAAAAADQVVGNDGGQLVGAIAGGAAARALAHRSPKVAQGADALREGIGTAKVGAVNMARRAVGAGTAPHGPATKPLAHKLAPKLAAAGGKLARRVGPAGMVGAAIGGTALGAVGGYAGYGHALKEEDRWKKVGRQQVAKYALPVPSTPREHVEVLRRKQRNAGLSYISSATGAAGVAAGLATLTPLRRKVPGHLIPKIERAGLGTALAGGGIGSYNTASNARIARRENREELGSVAKNDPQHAGIFRTAESTAWRAKYGNRHGEFDPAVRDARRTARAAQRDHIAARRAAVAPPPTPAPERWTHRLAASKLTTKGKLRYALPAAAVGGALTARATRRGGDHRHLVADTSTGAVAGFSGYVGGGALASQAVERRQKAAMTARDHKAVKEHRKLHGLGTGKEFAAAHAKEKDAFFANYPRQVPYSGARRLLARTHGATNSKFDVAALLGAAAGAGVALGGHKREFGKALIPVTGAPKLKVPRPSTYRRPSALGKPPIRVRASLG